MTWYPKYRARAPPNFWSRRHGQIRMIVCGSASINVTCFRDILGYGYICRKHLEANKKGCPTLFR